MTGWTPTTRMSSGVMSEPPPMPVSPMRTPTPRPKRTTSGSTSGRVESALDLARPGPAAAAPVARLGAGHAADGGVAAVVELVVGQVAVEDPAPDVLLGPLDERRDLVQA